MFLIGDRVRVIRSHDGLTGTVVELLVDPTFSTTEYVVEFDDKKWIPARMGYSYWQLEKIESYKQDICECALKYDRHGGKHSVWCPAFKEDE